MNTTIPVAVDSRRAGELVTPVVARSAGPGVVMAYVAAMFAGPWLVWGSRLLETRGVIGWHLPQGLALWIVLPSLLVATLLTTGRPGLVDLGRRLLRWRVSPWCYAAALLVPIALAFAAVGLTDGPVPLGSVMSGPSALLYLAYGIPLFALTEEAGWRGALLPRLQFRRGPLVASLVLGLVWGLWHLPSLAIPDGANHGLPVLGFVLLVLGTSVLVAALANAARGSVLLAALFHASFDACYSFTGVVGGGSASLFWTTTALTAVAALCAVLVTRGRLFAR